MAASESLQSKEAIAQWWQATLDLEKSVPIIAHSLDKDFVFDFLKGGHSGIGGSKARIDTLRSSPVKLGAIQFIRVEFPAYQMKADKTFVNFYIGLVYHEWTQQVCKDI